MSNPLSVRPYQIEALNAIDSALQQKQHVLLKAIMGAGKTFLTVRLINKYWNSTNRRFAIVAHKQELVEQFKRTFEKASDINDHQIGICCAGLNEKSTDKRLVIGTIQTMINQLDDYTGCDLLIIDECHRVSIGTNSQYDQMINTLKKRKPNMRILGLTATDSRLGHGYIHGDRCKPGGINLFDRVDHQIKYSTLRDQGYLMQLDGKIAKADSLSADLAGVATNGDYVLDQLGEIMTREIHLHTAAEAIDKYCSDFERVCVFCCTIDHAEQLSALIPSSTTIHSQLTPLERAANMSSWRNGDTRIITSVNILVEGFDFPALDCLVMARPTLSSTLFLQAVGRVLRTAPGKEKALLLDLTDNTARFGTDLDNVAVTVPKSVEKMQDKEDEMYKICPKCEDIVHKALRVCECGFEWPPAECVIAEDVPELSDVTFEPVPPKWREVSDMTIIEHQSRASKKWLIRLMLDISESEYKRESVSLWMCLPDEYTGYAVEKSRQLWAKIGIGDMPESTGEAIERYNDFLKPDRVLLDSNGKYPEVREIETEVPF